MEIYSLKSLAFPAYIVKNVSADPGILFVVLNPDERGNKRVFWKYMSVQLISSINFSQDSVTLTFSPEEEILDTNDSVNCFCEKLLEIVDHHSFVKSLETREYSENDIKDIIFSCNEQIVEDIERIEDFNDTRDNVSKRILNRLNDLCVSTLLLFSVNNGNNQPNLNLAWEQSFLDIETKYLGEFYIMLKYRGYRIPSEGQAERLMLKYYNFMWQIRKDLNDKFGIQILNNLEKFPLKIDDKVDKDYYKSVAVAVDSVKTIHKGVKGLRYYLQKKTPFFVGKERYYEITLQLAGVYATKYNRITAYTKHNISTNYSIQIRYEEAPISLWGTTTNIKVITDWKVSIFPSCLNSLAKILYLKTNINSTYGEYNSLSDYNIIFVDECSTIDNRTMVKFLNRIDTNTLLVMAGDIHQIEAIEFGNWFYYAKEIIKTAGSNVELLSTWRTKEENLIQLWDAVRNKQKLITEKLAYDGPFSEDIGPNIFKKEDDDEVVLCLNYDGKFGLNNINNYFQNVNFNGEIVTWQEWTYKVGDPILFNDTKRFSVLYNNLKGKIFDIVKSDNKIEFTIDVDTILTENDCQDEELDFLGVNENTTRIKFAVYEDDGAGTEQERKLSRMRAVVPFQLAYAVSIHKSQGLEYNSVKIIIPSSNAEKITHGIFYTAITRAKKNLKIFWSPETMRDIIKGFEIEVPKNKSLEIVKQRLY